MALPDDAVHPVTPEAWRAWLQEHHERATGVWLVSFKQATGRPRVTYEAAVEEALCFGWIDGILKRIDDEQHVIRFSPRRKNSVWSDSNRKRVNRMTRQGKMTEAGLAAVREAKKNGRWQQAGD